MKFIFAFIIGAALWRLGGYQYKWARRFVLPFFIALNLFTDRIKEKKNKKLTLISFPLLILAFSLGYGEKHPYWRKFMVGAAWVLPAFLFLGVSYMRIAIPFI